MALLHWLGNLDALFVLEEAEDRAEVRRMFHDHDDPFDLPQRHFIKLFRLNKRMVDDIISIVEEFSNPPSRTSALDASVKVFTALRFYASGSYQLDVGKNIHMATSQSSVSRSIQEVTNILNRPNIFNHWVHFPKNVQDLMTIRNNFYAKHQFPGVIGCIDCTHVAIFPPKQDDAIHPEYIYVNRKGYHSINVQLICDSDLKILHVNARYPGSCHDSFIWNNCNVLPLMQVLHARGYNNFYLLGDSGYALRPWLLTPVADAVPGTPAAVYNERFKSTRSTIERCNGLLKMRFRCLLKHRALHYSPSNASKIMNACTVLHNMCVYNNIPEPEQENDDVEADFGMYDNEECNENDAVRRINPELAMGRRIQLQLIRNYFRN